MSENFSKADAYIEVIREKEENLMSGLLAIRDSAIAAQIADIIGPTMPVAATPSYFGPYEIQQVWGAMRECVRRGQPSEGLYVLDVLQEWGVQGRVPPPPTSRGEWLAGSELYATNELWLIDTASDIASYIRRQKSEKELVELQQAMRSQIDDSEIRTRFQSAYLSFESDETGWADDADVLRFLTEEPPAQEWLFEDCLPKYCLGVFAGPPAGSKGMLTLEMGVSLALGCEWFKTKAAQGKMLYLTAEDQRDEIHRRLYKIAARHNLSVDERLIVAENLRARYVGGQITLFKVTKEGEIVRNKGFYKLQNAVRKFKPDVVVVDTWSKFSGIPENNNELTSQACGILENEICLALKCNIVVLAHTAKSNWGDSDKETFFKSLTIEAVRGASALVGSARWVMLVSPMTAARSQRTFGTAAIGTKDYEFVAYRVAKNSNAPLSDTRYVHRLSNGTLESVDATNSEEEARWNELQGDVEEILSVIRAAGPNGANKNSIKACVHLGAPKLNAAIKHALEDGKIRMEHKSGNGGMHNVYYLNDDNE